MAVLTLNFIREARSGLARLYENPRTTARLWIPRSEKVTKSTLKLPPVTGQPEIHQVEIADWWLDKNPWPDVGQKELKI